MFNGVQILSVTGWNMLKFDCFLSLCMEIPLSDDKYWAINLFWVQKRFLVFRMFFWCYNDVTRDLLRTAVSFNLMYLASMSILGIPPGATRKIKFFIIAQLYGNSMQVIMSWTLRRSHLEERMKELSDSDCSEYWAAQTKWSAGVLRVMLLRVLLASMVNAGWTPTILLPPGSPPLATAQLLKCLGQDYLFLEIFGCNFKKSQFQCWCDIELFWQERI